MKRFRLFLPLAVCAVATAGLYTDALAGTGFFGKTGQILPGTGSTAVALGDLDGDADLDAVVSAYGTVESQVRRNDGDGLFADSGQSLGTAWSDDVALGDLDGDGDLDVFLAHRGPNRVWLNNGAGVMTDSGQGLGNGTTYSVALGDLDGDGDLDAYAANYNEADKVWRNDGDGVFTDNGQSLDASRTNEAALGDFNGDGTLDVILATETTNSVWFNDGTATFINSGQGLGNSVSYSVALADLDNDGDLDAHVGNSGSDRVWLNSGGVFGTNNSLVFGGGRMASIAHGDFNGDGLLDVYWGRNDGLLLPRVDSIFFGDAVKIFDVFMNLPRSTHVVGATTDVALGDLDGDGDLDAYVSDYIMSDTVLLNQGAEQKAFFISPASGTYPKVLNSDLTLMLLPTGAKPKSVRILFNGNDVTPLIIDDFIVGLIDGGGWTFRLADLMGGLPPPGTHTLQVLVEMSDGRTLYDTAVWTMMKASEPANP